MVKPPTLDSVPEPVARAYLERVSHFKKAKIYQQKDDIPRMVESVRKYLNAVAAFHGVEEKQLHPNQFKGYDHVSEQLLISHAYWDLCKAYDRSEKLQEEAVRCLKQFALFSIGFKYQYANSVMIKKYLRQRKANNVKAFQQAYDKIYVKAKGCFVSTYAFGSDHMVTNQLRLLRDDFIETNHIGVSLMDRYYKHSPRLVTFLENLPSPFKFLSLKLTQFLLYPVYLVSKLLVRK
ncbi:MAG: hypothetical protein EP319_12235 [Deltaproteobacteria bacterium]|nr:MAG: hypothetical protein EP319_12235 [Deltaproteobacteria bacterium]